MSGTLYCHNTFLQVDGPAMFSWMVDPAAVTQSTTPTAWIGGADSAPAARDSRAQCQEWLPSTRAFDIAGAGHYFPVLKPAATATALDEWLTSQRTAH